MKSLQPYAAIVLVLLLAACASAGPSPQAARQALAPNGKLRVALIEGSPVHVVGDPRSGEARGVSSDLGRALAAELGVAYEPVAYKGLEPVLAGARQGQWDVAFLGVTEERARFMDFTGRHMALEFGYLVAPGSRVSSMDQVDRHGVCVAVVEKGTPDVFLTNVLREATLVRVATLPAALDLLRAGKCDAIGGVKGNLHDAATRYQGSRVLEGSPGNEVQALALPKGRDGAIAYSHGFIDRAKSSGSVRAAIERAGLRGALVAP